MNLPKAKIGSFILVRTETSTGIVMNFDNSYYLNQGENYYKIFDSVSDLKNFIEEDKTLSKLRIEYSIFNHEAEFLECIQ